MSGPPETCGWGGRIRTSAWWNQNPLPYRLATPHYAFKRADHSRDRARLQRGTCNLGKIVPRKRIKSFQMQGISDFFCTMDRQDETGEARAFNCLSRRTEMQAIDSVMQACRTTVLPRLLHAIIKGEVYSSRSVAQSGSAPRSGRGGRRFKSYRSDHSFQWFSANPQSSFFKNHLSMCVVLWRVVQTDFSWIGLVDHPRLNHSQNLFLRHELSVKVQIALDSHQTALVQILQMGKDR